MTPTRVVSTVAALTAAVGALATCFDVFASPAWWAVPLLALAVAGSEMAVVNLQFGRQSWSFSLTESALGAAFVVGTGSWTTAGVLLGVLIAQTVLRRPTLKKFFNLSIFGTGAAIGSLAAGACGGGIVGAIAGLGAFFLVNNTLVGLAISVTSQRPLLPMLVSSAPLSLVHTAGNSSIGLLAAYLAMTAPVGLFGLIVPLALLWTSYDQQTRRSQEARLFAELAAGQERATGRSSDSSARVVVTAAARLFGGADVEMVLLAADGPVRYAGDESGTPQRLRVESEVFDEPWVMRALGAKGVSVGVEDGRPWCSGVLAGPGGPQAVLVIRRGVGSPPFGRADVRLAAVLVGQAQGWLSVADLQQQARTASEQVEMAGSAARGIADLGAATAPALTVLRESADRLVRLAMPARLADGSVDDIVEELHLVERAVASLLGAIALAADPDLVGVGDLDSPAPASRPATDWTTTGILR
ncbi:MAG: hypothetical protein JWO27_238 [Frankiales bacterium]|nr:hypothetical protein [Frankiales bacterium]